MKNYGWLIVLLILGAVFFIATPEQTSLPDGRPPLYQEAQQEVKNHLIAPASAVFPAYDTSFVTYDESVLEDLGKGKLEYRVYDVKAYVDSQNKFGAMLRANFWVKVYCYVDDYQSPKFGETGIHKGIPDHDYTVFQSLEELS